MGVIGFIGSILMFPVRGRFGRIRFVVGFIRLRCVHADASWAWSISFGFVGFVPARPGDSRSFWFILELWESSSSFGIVGLIQSRPGGRGVQSGTP